MINISNDILEFLLSVYTEDQLQYNLAYEILRLRTELSKLASHQKSLQNALTKAYEDSARNRRLRNNFQAERDYLIEKLVGLGHNKDSIINELRTIPLDTYIRLRKGIRNDS